MSSGNKWIDDQIAAAGGLLAQQWAQGKRPVQPENDLGAASQKYELRVKMLEDRMDAIERALRKHNVRF